jgi:hypothetical protein
MIITKALNIKKVLFVILFITCSCVTYSQSSSHKKSLDRITYTDSDSLLPKHLLTHEQILQIYSINIELGNQERELQSKYGNSDSIMVHMQSLEVKKDSYYRKVLPQDKYQLYKQKKLKLVGPDQEVLR